MTDRSPKSVRIIFALIISIAAWIYVTYNYQPMTHVRYKDVPIKFIGEDTLAERGYGITDTTRESLYVVLNQRRISMGNITSDSIKVTADVSEATAGDNSISLSISGPDGTQIVESETKYVSVHVEETESKEVDVFVAYRDASDPEAEPVASDISETKAVVTGAASVVDKIDGAYAYLTYDGQDAGSRTYTRSLVAVDAEGNDVPHVVIFPEKVKFRAEPGLTKTVDLIVNVSDDSDDNYERTYTAPETIVIKGSADAIEKIDAVSTTEMNIEYMYQDTVLALEYELPEGISIANESKDLTATVRVTEVD